MTRATVWVHLEHRLLSEKDACLGLRAPLPSKQKAGGFSNRSIPTALGQTSEIRASGWLGSGEALLWVWAGVFTASSRGGRAEEASWGLFYGSTNPIHGVSTLHVNSSPPQGPHSSHHHLGVRFQHMNLRGGHQHPAPIIYSLYGSIYKKHPEQANPDIHRKSSEWCKA